MATENPRRVTNDADATATDTLSYPLPDGSDIKDDYLREVWRAAVEHIASEKNDPAP